MRSETRDEFLYDPLDEHDACGVGFVANVSGCANHNIIKSALEALRNLTHRGAVDADGRTGDGAGLLTQLPLKFFRREAERLGLRLDANLAVGVFFLPREESAAAQCRHIITRLIEDHGLTPLVWRQVPVEEGVLGAKALTTAPRIEQLLVASGRVPNDRFETTLYRARREIEQQLSEINGFYIPSLSSRTIVYKGLFVGSQIGTFYPDLNDPEFEAPLAVFHQRYSTNTFPNWALAQPFRLLAHNGEINTISGNRSWMRARELDTRFLASMENGSRLRSVIWNRGSDSASLDNALELSVRSGRGVTESVMMLIPEAYENSNEMSSELRAFYDYAAHLTEPWDGPAAIAFTDGQIVAAALDRNGLRPARYVVTRDGLVIVASEAGVIRLAPDRIAQKGRLGPGQMIAVDTAAGVLLANDEIKRWVATRSPSASLRRRARVEAPDLDGDHIVSGGDERELIRRMKSFGYTVEDVERILGPMLANGKEPVGSMGDDTPLAMLSSKPRLLYSYFKQRFAQVTNPAIDPIRERLVMSLTTLLGSRAPLTDELPANSPMLNLASPIQTEAMLEWLTGENETGLGCATLPAVFEIAKGGDGLKLAIAGLCRSGSEAVKSGRSILIISDLVAGESQAPIPMLLAVGALHNHLIREGQRIRASLIAHSGEARDDHQIACLVGFGANAVCPSLGFDVIAHEGPRRGLTVSDAVRNYRRALEDGLLKIMAKMGISTVAGYCGSQTFEIVGLEKRLVEEYFSGAPSRLTGIGLDQIAADARRFYDSAR